MEKFISDPSSRAPVLFRNVPSLQSMQSKQQEWKPLTLRTCPIPQSEEQVDIGTCYRDHLSRGEPVTSLDTPSLLQQFYIFYILVYLIWVMI